MKVANKKFERDELTLAPQLNRYSPSMARPIRIEYAGALYYVTSRGDRQEDIFLDDGDRVDWLEV